MAARRDRHHGLSPGRVGIEEDASETFADLVKVRARTAVFIVR
jgi:hypothetical protein